jgi:hypothetical protein
MRQLFWVLGLASLLLTMATAAQCQENGLVAHWTMDEIVGGIVPDVTGHGHDAKVGGVEGAQPQVVPGIIGKALTFQEDQEPFLSVAKPEDLALLKRLTVMAWIKPVARNKAYEIIGNKGDKSGNPPWPGWRFRFFWTRIMFQYGTADGKEPRATSPEWSVPAGFWSHVAATFDGQTIRVFVNGVEKGSAPGEGEIMPRKSPVIIGNYVGRKNAYAFDGLLDDVKVFSRPLTVEEIFAESVKGMQ